MQLVRVSDGNAPMERNGMAFIAGGRMGAAIWSFMEMACGPRTESEPKFILEDEEIEHVAANAETVLTRCNLDSMVNSGLGALSCHLLNLSNKTGMVVIEREEL